MMMNVGTVIGWVVLALVLVFALAALICVLLLKSGGRGTGARRAEKGVSAAAPAEHAAGFLPRGFPCWR